MEASVVKVSNRFGAEWRSDSELGNWRLFVELDPEAVVVEIYEFWGNGTPGRAFDGKTILWTFPLGNKSSVSSIVEFLEGDGQELLGRVRYGHDMRFDGSNYRGFLNEDAREADEDIEKELQDLWEQTPEIWSPSEWFDSINISDESLVREICEAGSLEDYASEQATMSDVVLCASQVERYLKNICRKVAENNTGRSLDAKKLLGEDVSEYQPFLRLESLYDKADMDEIWYVLDHEGENMANALVFEIGSHFFVGYTDELDGWKVLEREYSKKLTLSLELPSGT